MKWSLHWTLLTGGLAFATGPVAGAGPPADRALNPEAVFQKACERLVALESKHDLLKGVSKVEPGLERDEKKRLKSATFVFNQNAMPPGKDAAKAKDEVRPFLYVSVQVWAGPSQQPPGGVHTFAWKGKTYQAWVRVHGSDAALARTVRKAVDEPFLVGIGATQDRGGGESTAAPLTSASPEQAQQTHDRAVAEAELTFRQAVLRAKQEYLEKVKAALKAAMLAENLEEANRIDAIRKRLEKEIQAILSGEELKATAPLPVVVASSGFNESKGLHAGPKKAAPFKIGESVIKGGESEPGWRGPWAIGTSNGPGSKDLVTVVAAAAKEGDGGARVNAASRTVNTHLVRVLAKAQTGKLRIDQWIRGDDDKASLAGRPSGQGSFGPNWMVGEGHFIVLEGKTDGTNVVSLYRKAFDFKPKVWYKVSVVIDVPAKTWEFFVNDKKLATDKPLRFRGSPKAIETVDYLFGSPFDLDAIEVVQLSK